MQSPEAGSYYCAFEGLKSTHPSWDVRIAYLQNSDTQAKLWHSMMAFQNGVFFLKAENYEHAEACFQKVAAEFPDCWEASANLGYALLMQYCDALDERDLRSFDIGHLVVGGFYHRPESLTPNIQRGMDEDLWLDAVGALRDALRIHSRSGATDDLLLVKANLAVAYLIRPSGKDFGEAEKYFEQVLTALNNPNVASTIDPLVRASIRINAGAGRGIDEQSQKQILAELRLAGNKISKDKSELEMLEAAMQYTQARSLAVSNIPADRSSALKLFETYLQTMNRASSWWPVAYSEYKDLASKLSQTPKAISEFAKPSIEDWRPVTSIEFSEGKIIGLGQVENQIKEEIGEADTVVPVIAGTNIKRSMYNDHGVTILSSREVLAIFLSSEASPKIKLIRTGLGGETVLLSVGMDRADLEAALGDEWSVELVSIVNPNNAYQFYRQVGIAVQYDQQKVKELVIVNVPIESR